MIDDTGGLPCDTAVTRWFMIPLTANSTLGSWPSHKIWAVAGVDKMEVCGLELNLMGFKMVQKHEGANQMLFFMGFKNAFFMGLMIYWLLAVTLW